MTCAGTLCAQSQSETQSEEEDSGKHKKTVREEGTKKPSVPSAETHFIKDFFKTWSPLIT